jgi:predicted ArsR family transcriptional regulator
MKRRETVVRIAGPTAWAVLLELLGSNEPTTQERLMDAVGRSQPAVSRALAALTDAGLVVSEVSRQGQRGRPRATWRANGETARQMLDA